MHRLYQGNARMKIDKMRCIQMENHTYDINKLQSQRKFEGQSRIDEIDIAGKRYNGTEEVVCAIHEMISEEVYTYSYDGSEEEQISGEETFLSKLNEICLSDEEKTDLLGPISKEEIIYILKHEVDLDSSPGEDGLTYRFFKGVLGLV